MGEDSQAPWSQSFLGDPRQTGLPVLHLLISGAVPSGRPAPTPSFKSQTHFPKKRRDHRVVSATGPLQRLFLHWEYHAQSLLGGSFFTRKLGPQRDLGCPPCGPLNTHTLAHSHSLTPMPRPLCFSSQPCDRVHLSASHLPALGHGLAPRQCSAHTC